MATAGLEQMKGTSDEGRLPASNEEVTPAAKLEELLRGLKDQAQAQAQAPEQAGKHTDLIASGKQAGADGTGETPSENYTVSKAAGKTRKVSVPASIPDDHLDQTDAAPDLENLGLDLSAQLHELINNNSGLGSRLLSLLLVSSGNAKDIISAVNKGDLSKLQGLTERQQVPFKSANPSATSAGNKNKNNNNSISVSNDTTAPEKLAPSSKDEIADSTENENDLIWRQLEKRRKNTEASARFRIRKKQREKEKFQQLQQLTTDINDMYDRIDSLIDENSFWKKKLEELNDIKSKELLDNIKRRSGL
ncbi:unnamed protein product [Kluyveromyces dobzhanskii CBS 2104]|uniref:WGS project CCBQ000000000 data, contig 00012 n=1 Tax=Kluyveromyces dobzhanskii CBS 2104 TaxID=1427455 RepID=A0A0A8L0H4_9SACH|nr:unnamed protein product [Kluyveromyces dobzhanskii CBS 2104]